MVFEGSASGKWFTHEGRALMNEISAFIKKKKIPDSSLAPATMQKHNKKMSMSRTQTLNSNEFAGTFILDFSASRNYKKYISVAYKTRVYGILL